MSLVPENYIEADHDVEKMTDETFYIDFEENEIEGKCSGLEAVKQSIYKILSTERYEYDIYDRNYGIELRDLIGKPSLYVAAIIKGRIEEALLYDERIENLDNFEIERKRDSITVKFEVDSVYGNGKVSKSFVI